MQTTAASGSPPPLSSVLDSLFVFVGVLTVDGILIEANKSACVAAGVRPDEVLGKRFADSYWWSYSPAVQAQLEEAIARVRSGESVRYDVQIRLAGDRLGWIDFLLTPLRDENGVVTHLIPSATQIDERKAYEQSLKEERERLSQVLAATKRHEAALQNSEARLKALFDLAAIGIAEVGLDGRWLRVNAKLCQITGYSEPEMLATTFQAITHPDDVAADLAAMERLARGEISSYAMEKRYLRKDGSHVWVQITGSGVFGPSGRPDYYVAIVEDISERKAGKVALEDAIAAAERANNAKSRFLAAASHDLRQPLGALTLYVGVLKNKLFRGDPLFANIQGCLTTLNELLTDLLDVSKLDAGVVKPNISNFAVGDMQATLVSMHLPEAQLKGISLRYVRSPLIARSDPVLFSRMVGNLVSNAVRYTESGGVLVGCRRRAGKRWIEVWDTGIGIPKDKTKEIFEEFTQLRDDSRTRGSGLGLAIVAKIATLLGLQIRVRTQPGRGSMFAIELPVGRAHKPSPPPKARPLPMSLRIGLVEDNAGVLNAVSYALENLGHTVVAATSGADLIDRLHGRAPDLVISDYRLARKETGFDVVTAAREHFAAELPAIILTGDTDPDLIASMAQRGVAIQHKPVDIEALQACIGEVAGIAKVQT